MKSSSRQLFIDRPLVFLFSNDNSFSLNITENLLINFCRVKVVTENINPWRRSTTHLKNNKHLSITTDNFDEISEEILYGVYISDYYLGENNIEKDFRNIENNFKVSKKFKRVIYIFPHIYIDKQSEIEKKIDDVLSKDSTFKIIFSGNIIGPRMSLATDDILTNTIKQFLTSERIFIPEDPYFVYPIYIGDIAKRIVKELFTFGKDKKIIIIGPKTNIDTVVKSLMTINSNTKVNKKKMRADNFNFSNEKVVVAEQEIGSMMQKTVGWFENYENQEAGAKNMETKIDKKETLFKRKIGVVKQKSSIKIKPPKRIIKVKKAQKKRSTGIDWLKTVKLLTKAFILVFIAFMIPAVFLMVAVFFILYGRDNIYKGDLLQAEKAFIVAEKSSTIARGQYGYVNEFLKFNFVGSMVKYSNIVNKTAIIGRNTIKTINLSSDVFKKVFQGDGGEIQNQLDDIVLNLDWIYRESGFIVGEIEDLGETESLYIKKATNIDFVREIRKDIVKAKRALKHLPQMLAEDGKKNYLILFQNNMELRPTGGFIGSFAVTTFNQGRMININIFDVYSADGQLKGYVKPPDPLSKYLKVDSWYLRDSNWDPEFAVSAQRAEWFLDKEMDIQVDGVVSIDLNFVKELIGAIGEIHVSEYDRTLNEKNFYEITQYEAQKDFFPGSKRKANFLTALANQLINEVKNPEDVSYPKMASAVYAGLEKRNIQIHMHDEEIQRAVEDLGWSGGIERHRCGVENCYSDFVGLVEANLGVNKANYYLKRSAGMVVKFSEDKIRRTLTLKLVSDTNPALGNKGKYEAYIRLMVPRDSEVRDVVVRDLSEREAVSPDIEIFDNRLEVGVYVKVLSGKSKDVVFNWTTDNKLNYTGKGEYILNWRKQAGTGDDPIKVVFDMPYDNLFREIPEFSLTQGKIKIYNTSLSRDFISRIYW